MNNVNSILTNFLAKLSSNQASEKYLQLQEMYKFIFGIPIGGDGEHYLTPL